jgi:hypothetical protein
MWRQKALGQAVSESLLVQVCGELQTLKHPAMHVTLGIPAHPWQHVYPISSSGAVAQVGVVLWWWVDAWLETGVEVQMAVWCGVEVCIGVDGVTCAGGGWRGPDEAMCA